MASVLRRIGLAISVGLADSLNPSTVGPALYMATLAERIWRVTQFTIGVFSVTLVGGLVLTIGPGRLLLGLVPHPQGTVRHVVELVAGVILLLVAIALWVGRRSLARRKLPGGAGGGHSALVTGASIAAIELPTAAPYFAVITGLVASTASVPQEIGLLLLYNVAFVLPLLAIIVLMLFAGHRADPWLQKGGAWLQRRWPAVLAGLLTFVGSLLAILGGSGLLRQ
jgi:cytochrome c biogenesis protein CcdA